MNASRIILRCTMLSLVTLVVALAASRVFAFDAALKKRAATVAKMLQAKTLSAEDKQEFDNFFQKAFLPQFEAQRDNLPKDRKDLRLLMNAGKSGEAHARLNQLTLDKMKAILEKGNYAEYDIPIKYNALLVIGELNETEDEGGKKGKPLPAAYPILYEYLSSEKSPDYLKVAALIGFDRIASVGGVPQAKQAELTKTLLELVKQQDPPAGRDQAAHDFMRRSAAQVLALLGNPGPGNAVLKAFETLSADDRLKPTMRSDMSQFIGQLKIPTAAKVDMHGLANGMGKQWVELCRQEIEDAEADDRTPSRRLIGYSTYCNWSGLKGLKAAIEKGDESEKYIDRLKTKLFSIMQELDNTEDLPDKEVASKMSDRIAEVEGLLGDKSARKETASAK